MSKTWSLVNGRLEVTPGSLIDEAAKESVAYAKQYGRSRPSDGYCILNFNGVAIKVWADSTPGEIVSEFYLRRRGNLMDSAFKVHKLNAQGLRLADDIASLFDGFMAHLSTYCPQGRELSIARTKLEEACFFFKKSMATDERNQEK